MNSFLEGDMQRSPNPVAEQIDSVAFGLEIIQSLIGQNEVQKDQAGVDGIQRVALAIAKVVLANLAVNSS